MVAPPFGRAVDALRAIVRVAIGTALLLGSHPAVARGQVSTFDLTGAWSGKLTCKGTNAGVKETVVSTPALAVTQSGNAVGLRMDFGAGVVVDYVGRANPDGKKPLEKGELGVIRCGTDTAVGATEAADEIGRLSASAKLAPSSKGTLKGSSVLARSAGLATCTWKWTRTGTADPGVATECER